MSQNRCPYHVKQGIVDSQGQFILSDICGVRTACGAPCALAPFEQQSHGTCPRFLAIAKGTGRQVLVPKNDIEYLPEINGVGSFGEIDLM